MSFKKKTLAAARTEFEFTRAAKRMELKERETKSQKRGKDNVAFESEVSKTCELNGDFVSQGIHE